ncbi:hypothetical protein BYT27DRAFT_7233763 [Phlegmacium glaucopus]|nr:hypothetical protein BYT27DRAFT_7233763 [Phlegmacium glaucopus]
MIPRFRNPHFLSQSTKVITRAELDAENEDSENPKYCLKEDSKTIEQLHQLLGGSLPTWDVSDVRSSKRRKIEENDQMEEDPVLFRLISSTLPAFPVSLFPPPPPPSITREPEAEDNELQAAHRRKRAEAAAINVGDVLPRIRSTQVPDSKKFMILRAVTPFPDPKPHLMIVQRLQPSRKTRPPVGSSELLHHPYVPGDPTKLSPSNTSNAKCPSIEVLPQSSSQKGRRRRRWKEALRAKERPPPQYYRPNPRWEGKCRGYGYGYPSSFAMAEGYDNTVHWKYERDTMKKIVCL